MRAFGKKGGSRTHEKFMRDYAIQAVSVGTRGRKHFRVQPDEVARVLAEVAQVRGQQMEVPLLSPDPAPRSEERYVRVKIGKALIEVPVSAWREVAEIMGWL